MNTVFVVLHGCSYESLNATGTQGGNVIGVFADATDAFDFALAQETYFDGGWVLHTAVATPTIYVNGCDFVRIEAFEVK